MSRRWLVNLVLLMLVAALGLLAWWRPGKEEPPPDPPLLETGDIRLLEIRRPGGDAIRLVREAPGWRMELPYAAPANAPRLQQLLDALQAPVRASYPLEEIDAAAAGLAEPQLVISVNGETRLAFGGAAPVDYRRYVRRGQRVLLIDSMDFYPLNVQAEELVSRRLLPEGAEIARLELPGLTLASQPDGGWELNPSQENVSADAIQTLLDAWRDARALDVMPANGTDAAERVRVFLKGREEPLLFLPQNTAGGFRLVRPDQGLAYELAGASRDSLLQLPEPENPPAGDTK